MRFFASARHILLACSALGLGASNLAYAANTGKNRRTDCDQTLSGRLGHAFFPAPCRPGTFYSCRDKSR